MTVQVQACQHQRKLCWCGLLARTTRQSNSMLVQVPASAGDSSAGAGCLPAPPQLLILCWCRCLPAPVQALPVRAACPHCPNNSMLVQVPASQHQRKLCRCGLLARTAPTSNSMLVQVPACQHQCKLCRCGLLARPAPTSNSMLVQVPACTSASFAGASCLLAPPESNSMLVQMLACQHQRKRCRCGLLARTAPTSNSMLVQMLACQHQRKLCRCGLVRCSYRVVPFRVERKDKGKD